MPTPVRRQYLQLKRNHPDAILFFRMGDFYETFDEDARLVARELNIVLTAREAGKGNKVPMAGVPHHAAESYIARLVKAGHKVAICDQVSTETVKGLMPREVVRVVTPGTVIEPALLEAKQHNYLAGLVQDPARSVAGLAYIDITTGDFAATVLQGHNLERLVSDELARLNPAELVIPDDRPPPDAPNCHLTPL
ncbi:MAG: DNA mismatch repair protein MutS, partial [Anaerolineae bacterium]